MKTLAERIVAAQAALLLKKDALVELTNKMLESPDDDTLIAQVDSTAADIEVDTKSIESLQRAEAALASNANHRSGHVQVSGSADHKDPFNLMVRSALCTFEAHVTKRPLAQVINDRYGQARDFEQTKAVAEIFTNKATQNPALTGTAGWAQELTQQAYGAFMDLLAPNSVYAALPLESYTFDGFSSIYIPMRLNRTKNLAGAFRVEGAPIRVAGTTLSSMTLTPKSLGVISTFTEEMLRRSTPSIEALVRKWILEDTGISIDTVFLGTGAGSATQPAGIANDLGANTAVSTGNTAAEITADVRAMLQRMAAAQLGGRPVWVMDPQRKIGLELALTPTGTLAFPSVSANNTFLGYPIVTSLNVVDSEVFLIDCSQIAGAGGTPSFVGSDQATVHEEDTTPLEVGGSSTPVRSFYQTNTLGVRMLMEMDWKVFRSGAVQQLTAVGW